MASLTEGMPTIQISNSIGEKFIAILDSFFNIFMVTIFSYKKYIIIFFLAFFFSSYDDGIDEAVNSNFQVMFGGFSLIFVYIAATLGRWNVLEQRVIFQQKHCLSNRI